MAHDAGLRTEQKQGSPPLSEKQGSLPQAGDRRATETTSAPKINSAPSLAAPKITSADSTTFTVGKPCAFTVTSTGVPIPNLSELGKLPSRVRFKDNGNGTAALSGTPAANTGGTYKFTIIARNGASPDTQHFTLTVVRPRR